MCDRNGIHSVLLKPLKPPRFSSYSREIAFALIVKFLLLGGLWWVFFAGHKQPVDEALIAGKIFGDQHSAIISEKTGSVLNDQQ